jgi:glycosyltransferase involved in cell wall biosynthesis
MNFSSPFSGRTQSSHVLIEPETEIVFVSDMFLEHYVGGAELTTEALIEKCQVPYQKILSRDVSMSLLESGCDKHWIFGNFSGMNHELIPTIVANLSYSILEYDYKFCKYRSIEKHLYAENTKCNCEESESGKLISSFFYGAQNIYWMSESQASIYYERFPFLLSKNNTVLSSVFDDSFFVEVKKLREENKDVEKTGWIVLGSNSWVKGFDQAENFCKEKNYDYEVVWQLPYRELLSKLARAKGFVYLPRGNDTCPRMVIEAKLLGCELQLNEYVQHADEEWFSGRTPNEIEEYLYGSRELFWRQETQLMNKKPEVSGYTTTLNCITQKYPYRDCIESMLDFCEEVIVVDGGSTDGTWQELLAMSKLQPKIKPHQVLRDWQSPRFSVFDGLQKAEARKLCTKEFCWQMDADERVIQGDGEKILSLCKNWPQLTELVALPVIEYWGSLDKVRVDVNPWKWRISRNLANITHGIPKELRRHDENGDLYSSPGTDGCDYVDASTFERIPFGTFYSQDANNARMHALNGNPDALAAYEGWIRNCMKVLPTVEHFSWIDITRKIKTYRGYWQKHWESLYNITQEDTAENNMFFDKPWNEVSDQEIEDLAIKLSENTGGHIFHTKIDWSRPTPSMNLRKIVE